MIGITEEVYGGAGMRLARLNLGPFAQEVRSAASRLAMVRDGAGKWKTAGARNAIRTELIACGWTSTNRYEELLLKHLDLSSARPCVAVGFATPTADDVKLIRIAVVEGAIDVGILVSLPYEMPLESPITDRAPCMSDAKRHVGHAKAEDLPLILIAIEHDGAGPPLAKQKKK